MKKTPYCTFKTHLVGKAIFCAIRGVDYAYYAAGSGSFQVMKDNVWVDMTHAEMAAKPLVCQTLRDRYDSAQRQAELNAQRNHHAAEVRRRRLDRGQRRAYFSH